MKNIKNKPILGLILLLVIVLIYQMFSNSGNHKGSSGNSARDEGQALAAIFGGGGNNSSPSDQSIFDSKFWNAAVPNKALETPQDDSGGSDTGLLEPASEGNPRNPQTGQPYPDSVMRQFDTLRKKFPNNKIIPSKLSDEEVRKENEERNDMAAIGNLIAQNQAGESDINRYYDYEAKKVEDRLELVNYIIQEQGEAMSEDIKSKFQNVLEMNKNQKAANDKARQNALSRIGITSASTDAKTGQ